MKLIFRNSRDEERVIAYPETEDEAIKEMHKFVDEANKKRTDGKKFEIYYTRTWKDKNGRKMWDVGSHTEFFITE